MFPNPLSKGFHCFISTQGLTMLNILRNEFFESQLVGDRYFCKRSIVKENPLTRWNVDLSELKSNHRILDFRIGADFKSVLPQARRQPHSD